MNNLKKLFINRHLSFEILEKLGFDWKNNRLVWQYELLTLTNIKFCQLRYPISSQLKNTVINLLKLYQNNSNNNLNKTNIKDENVYALIAKMIDELPTSLLQENAVTIDKCVENNDFHALKRLKQKLHKKNVELYYDLIKTSNHTQLERVDKMRSHLTKRIRVSLDVLLADDKDIYNGDADIVNWLFGFNLATPVVNNLIYMIIECNFDLTKKDDRSWFAKIVADRWMGMLGYEMEECFGTLLNKTLAKYVDDVKYGIAKRELADNLYILLDRHKMEFFGKKGHNYNLYQLFEQDSKAYAVQFIRFASKSNKICELLLSNNNKSPWKCYHCYFINKNSINECSRCNKGVNPLWPARCNKSESFCVTKPFGLIKWKYNVCLNYVFGFRLYFLFNIFRNFQKFPEI